MKRPSGRSGRLFLTISFLLLVALLLFRLAIVTRGTR